MSQRIIEIGEPCRGNTGDWGRTVVYEFDGPLGPTLMTGWESLPEPEGPTVHERDSWKWINRCPVCNAEAFIDSDDLWWCDNGHYADMPNQEIVGRPNG